MAIKTILITAFAALVAAVPQHAEHIGKAQIARSNQLLGLSDLAGRTISYDGSCGSWSGMTCPGTTCCSAESWCGSSDAHCGTGCQAGFGQCGSSGASDTSAIPSPAVQTPAPVVQSSAAEVESSAAPSTTVPAPTSEVVASAPAASSSPAQSDTDSTDSASGVTGSQNKGVQHPEPVFSHSIPTTTTVAAVKTSSTSTTIPTPTPSASSGSTGSSSGLGDSYKMYTGDGSVGAGWPAQSSWVDFDTAFENNRGLMSKSCTQFGATNNNDDEISNLKSALQSVASSSGVDARFLLAIMMQESGGCVRAPTTNYGVRNPGLFQSHDGSGSCNDGSAINPCPMSEITQMVTDGAAGTAAGDGLKQTIAEAGTSDVSKYYRAARIYNSGSIAASGQLQDGIATHCYSSDVANRLTGWVTAAHGCSG
ncbi:hypothetical protein AMS68_004369 [Peltaster fructicola]|uniref:Chitin-binding type-1 domain-containing protein n=1 Tax=Peltaster fructicola TaxID=286661 RepID=A0A6H0XVQ9_9PEZI|nr:hypothetical protein AMS68_004369 [Peltaster fructicola]